MFSLKLYCTQAIDLCLVLVDEFTDRMSLLVDALALRVPLRML